MKHVLVAVVASLLVFPKFTVGNTITLEAFSQVYEGEAARFSITAPIITPTISAVTWTINGVPVNEESDLVTTVSGIGSRNVDLIISNVSVNFNGSVVTCVAVINNADFTCAPEAILLVQGILGPVIQLPQQYNALDSTVNISWAPPPALVIQSLFGQNTGRPEIFYCVQISDGAANRTIGCNRTADMNEETSVVLDSATCMVEYNVTVIPFNRLGDGPSITVQFPYAPVISDRDAIPQLNGNTFTYTYEVSGLVCSCSAVIPDASIEGNLLCNFNTPGFLTITTEHVTSNRKFTAHLFANNTRTFTVKEDSISTFDSDLTISSINSTLEYSLTFIGGSIARGVFIAILFMDRLSVDFSRSLYFTQERSLAEMTNQLMGLSAGRYEVLAYDVESSGKITSDNAADQLSVTVTGSSTITTPLQVLPGITCNSTENRVAVNVMCEFNTTLYSGYRVYIQHTSDVMLRFVESTVSGEMVSINGSLVGGEHLVIIYPIWNSNIPDGRLTPALKDTYNLDALITTPSPTSKESTVVFPTDSSFPPSTDPATSSPPVVAGPTSPFQDLVTIIAVIVVIIIIIIAASVLTVIIAITIVRRNMTRKKHGSSIFTSRNESYEVTSLKRVGEPEYEEIFPQDQMMKLSDNQCYGVLSQMTPATQTAPSSTPTSTLTTAPASTRPSKKFDNSKL